jgi:hypothetical protein
MIYVKTVVPHSSHSDLHVAIHIWYCLLYWEMNCLNVATSNSWNTSLSNLIIKQSNCWVDYLLHLLCLTSPTQSELLKGLLNLQHSCVGHSLLRDTRNIHSCVGHSLLRDTRNVHRVLKIQRLCGTYGDTMKENSCPCPRHEGI